MNLPPLEIHDASKFGAEYVGDGPTICRMNADGSCHPLLGVWGYAAEAEVQEIVDRVNDYPVLKTERDELLAACEALLQRLAELSAQYAENSDWKQVAKVDNEHDELTDLIAKCKGESK